VQWEVEFHKDFDSEFEALPDSVQNELLAHALLLERFGPQLGRPRVDTLKGSRHANMKELRFDAAGGVLARRVCVRPETQRGPAYCGRQVRQWREKILSPPHSKGRRKI
jgi:hypothetical protein